MFSRSTTLLAIRRLVGTSSPMGGKGLIVFPATSPSMLSPLRTSVRFHGDEEHGHVLTGDREKPITTHWTLADGTKQEVKCFEGQTLLEVAQEHQLPIEGACAGSCACSTCHVYLREEDYDKFEEPSDEENDMLDLAFFPQNTSRLGCQIKLRKAVDGLEVQLPKATRNMAVDGYVAKPH